MKQGNEEIGTVREKCQIESLRRERVWKSGPGLGEQARGATMRDQPVETVTAGALT